VTLAAETVWGEVDRHPQIFPEALAVRPKSDRLKGAYFQAVEKQTFNIEFVRVK